MKISINTLFHRDRYSLFFRVSGTGWIKLAAFIFFLYGSIGIFSGMANAQQPFAKRFGMGGQFGHSQLYGDMDKFLQGDFLGAVRFKYNYSERLAVDVSFSTHKRFLNRVEVPVIPALFSMAPYDDVNLSARISPLTVNANYYFSKWDTKPYATVGIGLYSINTNAYVIYPGPDNSNDVLINTTDRKLGINLGAGMETFLRSNISFELKACVHMIGHTPSDSGDDFIFPIKDPQFISFVVGITYYVK